MNRTQNSNRYLYLAIFAVICLLYAIFTLSKNCYELGYLQGKQTITKTTK